MSERGNDRGRRDDKRTPKRDGAPRRDGAPKREGAPKRDGASKRDGTPRRDSAPKRDGQRPPRRDGAPGGRPQRDGQRPDRGGPRPPRREGAPRGDRTERAPRPEREELTPEQLRFRELRAVRPRHDDPEIAEGVSWQDLPPAVKFELKGLTVENAEFVGNHLAMVALLLDSDPELAFEHATSAYRRGGRIGVVRETVGLVAYTLGDFARALREFQTYRRITGSNEQIGMEVDCERGLGRPERGFALAREIDRSTLSDTAAVQLAIALSGARLDQGKTLLALAELEIPQLKPDTAFDYSPALFDAYAEVLEELGRGAEAAQWRKRAVVAAQALDEAYGIPEEAEEFEVVTEYLPAEESRDDTSP